MQDEIVTNVYSPMRITALLKFVLLLLCLNAACASVKTPIVYLRPSSQLLTMRATLKEANETKARVYFRAKQAEVYELEYRTKRGSTFFHKYLLADRIYDEVPEGEFVVAIRAVASGKKSDWKKLSTR